MDPGQHGPPWPAKDPSGLGGGKAAQVHQGDRQPLRLGQRPQRPLDLVAADPVDRLGGHVGYVGQVGELLGELADATDVAAEAIHRVQRTQVERALWALPEPQRLAITLMDLGGFTAVEAAAMLGRPRGTVLAWVHRGRKALARAVREQEGDRHGP